MAGSKARGSKLEFARWIGERGKFYKRGTSDGIVHQRPDATMIHVTGIEWVQLLSFRAESAHEIDDKANQQN
jgi:hypothetical protein